MPTIDTFDISTALVDNNQKVFLDSGIAKLAPEGDLFGTVLDTVHWIEIQGNQITSGAPGKFNSSIAEAGNKLNWSPDLVNAYSIGERRSINYKDADIIAIWDPTDAETVAGGGQLWFSLWKQLDNFVGILYMAKTTVHYLRVYKRINGVSTELSFLDIGVQNHVEMRIKRVAATNAFAFHYRISGDPTVWTSLWSGIITDATHFPVNCNLYPLPYVYESLPGVGTPFQPSVDEYLQKTDDGIPAQRFWPDSPEIYLINGVGDEYAFNAGGGAVWACISVSDTKTEPGTSTIMYKLGVSTTGLITDVTWIDVAWQTIAQVSANAAAGNYDGYQYIHVKAQFNSSALDQPTLTDFTLYGGLVGSSGTLWGGRNTRMRIKLLPHRYW